jgi:DNA-binding response OmpR family regulator
VGRQLAADPTLAAIPVVMISALGAHEDRQAGLGCGARAYLVKPFSPFELLAKVAELTQPAAARAATLK